MTERKFRRGTTELSTKAILDNQSAIELKTMLEDFFADPDIQKIMESAKKLKLTEEEQEDRKKRRNRLTPEQFMLSILIKNLIVDPDHPSFLIQEQYVGNGIELSDFPYSDWSDDGQTVIRSATYSNSLVSKELSDLSSEQMVETRESYSKAAERYSLLEWSVSMVAKSHMDTRRPFLLSLLIQRILNSPILFAGCGTGRDIEYLRRDMEDLDILCNTSPSQKISIKPKFIGVDNSPEMLKIAEKRLSLSTELILDDICKLSLVQEESIGAVFCESALSHLSFENIGLAIARFKAILKPGGIAFLGFRTMESSNRSLYSTKDVFGKRYYMNLTREEQKAIFDEVGFEIIYEMSSQHPDFSRPYFTNYIVRKKGEVASEIEIGVAGLTPRFVETIKKTRKSLIANENLLLNTPPNAYEVVAYPPESDVVDFYIFTLMNSLKSAQKMSAK